MSNEKIIVKVEEINKDGKPHLRFSYVSGPDETYPIQCKDNVNRTIEKDGSNYYLIEGSSQLRERLETGDFEYCIFPSGLCVLDPSLPASANFTHAIFLQETDFSGKIFEGTADFGHATFTKKANFEKARFKEWVNFSETTFGGTADFQEAKFKKNAHFLQAKFLQEVDFYMATFTQDANFGSAYAYEEELMPIAFFGKDYSTTTFGGRSETIFNEYADFTKAKFLQKANFAEVIFEKSSNFYETKFEKKAIFWKAKFEKEAYFLEINYTSNTTLDLGLARFLDMLFLDGIQPINSEKPININLKQTTIENISYGDAQFSTDNRETFLTLKDVALKQNDRIRALEFHQQEYEQHLKDEKLKWWHSEKIILEFERCVSNFGTSIWRPSFWLLGVILAFYFLITCFICNAYLNIDSFFKFIQPTNFFRDIFLNCSSDSDWIMFLAQTLFLLYKILQFVLIYEIIKSFRQFSRNL